MTATRKPLAMTVKQAAELADCHPNTIYHALWSGELRGFQRTEPHGAWRIRPSDLETWLFGGTKK
ncbi:ssDNA-binding protein [Gordonia phage Schmidt]|uniref:SsDNA-binding protein n=1 Tax=Gordonia phage Schmidt TaxID=2301697 RepID=A0A385E2M5_9CAUD|nr:ssDNA binding protein [Gordonia phage Schmidt]AXQ65158.1 ssDNA-binding protein [Gordonia phage Schmidt]